MQIKFNDLLKDKMVYILLPVMVVVGLVASVIYLFEPACENVKKFNNEVVTFDTLTQKKAELEAQLVRQEKEDNDPDVKKIYSPETSGFGADASFAPLFDNVISLAKQTGIRIRSVNYDFAPANDPIFKSQIKDCNVCELSTTIVGKYSEIQSFLKSLLAEKYLINVNKVEIVSWQRDKSVLIANLKLTFYTRTN